VDLRVGKLRRARRFGRALVRADAVGLPFRDRAFDAVVASQLVERVPPGGHALTEMARVLRPGGRLVVATPDYGRRRWRFLGALYSRIVPGAGDHPPRARFSRRQLVDEVVSHGLELDAERHILGAEMILAFRK
jgi:ubiquinone/menaquinone biosynthesis C-methylase UbiE